MANLSRPLPSRQILPRDQSLRARGRRGWLAAAAMLLAALAALAWYDGGEEPLRPIAEPVALPGSTR